MRDSTDGPSTDFHGAYPVPAYDGLGSAVARAVLDEAAGSGREASEDEIRTLISDVFASTIPKLAEDTADKFDETLTAFLAEKREMVDGFRGRLARDWGRGFDRLAALLQYYSEIGARFLETVRHPDAPEPGAQVFVVSRLHIRSARIVSEILVLLEAGLADGAHARWRALHEVAVASVFMSRGDDDLAQRYLDHRAIQTRKSVRKVADNAEALGWEPPSQLEIAEVESKAAQFQSKYGKDFLTDFGWACHTIGKTRPTFADLEDAAGMSKWRPIYAWASAGNHGGAQGLHALGSDDVLAGASNRGLADPGQNTVISMEHIVEALTRVQPTMDAMVLKRAFHILARRCQQGFLDASAVVEARTAENLARPRKQPSS